jgi:catechol 2,3-dioxygenase-like lactoylglutathione lyase family enzyme
MIRWTGVCIDCADAEELAAFYGELLGWEITGRDTAETRLGGSGWVGLRDPEGGVGLSFQAEDWYAPPVWPEAPGEQDKMLHFEIAVDDLDAAIAQAIAAGATVAPQQPADRDQAQPRVMLDPAGHPFCLFMGD